MQAGDATPLTFDMKFITKNAILLVCALISSKRIEAAVLIQPHGIRTNMTTEFGNVVHGIDQSGLSTNYISGVTDFNSFTANHGNFSDEVWSTTDTLPGFIDFDLGFQADLIGMVLWYAIPNGNFHINEFTLRISEVDDFSSSPVFFAGDTARVIQTNFTFSEPIEGRYVRLEILTNNGAERTRLDEIAFAQVPEPSSVILLEIGSLALLSRRRRNLKSNKMHRTAGSVLL